jgi:hypothetical protein
MPLRPRRRPVALPPARQAARGRAASAELGRASHATHPEESTSACALRLDGGRDGGSVRRREGGSRGGSALRKSAGMARKNTGSKTRDVAAPPRPGPLKSGACTGAANASEQIIARLLSGRGSGRQ